MKCRFIVTYIYNDWDVNGCIGIYDNPNEAMGAIIRNVLDIYDGRYGRYDQEEGAIKDPKFTFEFHHDDGYDNYYDVTIRYEGKTDSDIYRVYYLREQDES